MKKTADRQITANEFVNVKDIRRNFLYTRDGYIMMYLRIYPYNLDLLSQEERRSKATALAASFDGDRKDFAYFTFPREIDLDKYKQTLKKQYSEEFTSLGRRHLLAELIQEATELATAGENYEHQHFIKLWKMVTADRTDSEHELRVRAEEFRQRYENAGIHAEILEANDILKMCNHFANPIQAPFENQSATFYENITKLL